MLNLTVKPVFDAAFNVQVAELARAPKNALLALMLDDFGLESERSPRLERSAGPIRGAASVQHKLAQAMGGAVEAAGLSRYRKGGRAVRTGTPSAGSPGCFGKSAGRAQCRLGSVWPQSG